MHFNRDSSHKFNDPMCNAMYNMTIYSAQYDTICVNTCKVNTTCIDRKIKTAEVSFIADKVKFKKD